MYPGAMDEASFFSAPKKHTRRPDSHWDHIIRGADVQSIWVENEKGEQEREIDGKLNAYDLRAKGVDPGLLGGSYFPGPLCPCPCKSGVPKGCLGAPVLPLKRKY